MYFQTNDHIRYGQEHESEAINVLQKSAHVKVKRCGIFIHHSGVLAASPDGNIPNIPKIVEFYWKSVFPKLVEYVTD